jgi:hypothetical protein
MPADVKSYITIVKMMLFLTIWIHIQACIWYLITKHNGIESNYIPVGAKLIHLIDGKPPFERIIGYCAEERIGYKTTMGWFFQLTDDRYTIDEP